MHVLLVNDDGVQALGIHALAEAFLGAGHRVTVSAPDRERSASGHALTMFEPLYAERVSTYDRRVNAWAVSGTPVDCARMGLTALATEPVDLVVSGINHGPNLGSDTIYSGTVAAAMEAVVLEYPALAVSLATRRALDCLPVAARWAVKVAEAMRERGFDAAHVFNLNIPALPESEIKGLRRATIAKRRYVNGYEMRTSPTGRDHYWLCSWPDEVINEAGTDACLLREGYATLTPLTWSLMDRAALDDMKAFEGGF